MKKQELKSSTSSDWPGLPQSSLCLSTGGLGTPVMVLPASVPSHPQPTVRLQQEDKVIHSEHN